MMFSTHIVTLPRTPGASGNTIQYLISNNLAENHSHTMLYRTWPPKYRLFIGRVFILSLVVPKDNRIKTKRGDSF